MVSTRLEDPKIHVRFKLSALWTSIMFCYIYGDFWGLYRPGSLKDILDGIGPLGPTSQGSLVAVSVLVAVPAVMVFLSLALPPALARWLNVLIGAALTAIVLATLPGAWAFYVFMSIVEVVLQLGVLWYAWRWPRQATP
ncbi:MAG: hypothetical protein HOQ10_07960 [Frateuria sp.]|uniref:DUF6326 family protein n=1 Tax=Frateuria sp. TaxID=2211372 RepID=UPI0017D5DFF0|nr:DUF6326 family protein [Frateuria sp.]NUO72635.1 hypothetical protein [Frateuria sp.]NUR23362.1 hypothetical protein [Frateuria sp.]